MLMMYWRLRWKTSKLDTNVVKGYTTTDKSFISTVPVIIDSVLLLRLEVTVAKVMIVDDDQTTTSLLETLLELDGFDVTSVSRGSDVITRAEQFHPDIFLMDYHLTDTEGVVILRQLRKHEVLQNIPVIIASGMDVEDEVIEAGANIFLVKPFEPADLPRLFNELING
jgi:CheY-like chemotaxis protein